MAVPYFWAIVPLLMVGGAYLSFEGAEKVLDFFHKKRHGAHDDHEDCARSAFALLSGGKAFAQRRFERRDELAEEHGRADGAPALSEQEVEHDSDDACDHELHLRTGLLVCGSRADEVLG